MEIIIEKAHNEDYKIADEFLTLLIQDERKYDETIDSTFVVKDFYCHIKNDPQKCLLMAKDGNKAVGFIYGYLQPLDGKKDNIAQIDALYVDENYRHLGIGKKLISEFSNWAKEKKTFKIEINVMEQNIGSRELYYKVGFKDKRRTLIWDIK